MSEAQSLILRIDYPQTLGLLSEETFDDFLQLLQRSEALLSYNCTLTTLKTPSIVTTTEDLPSLYSKSAPSYALGGSVELKPVILAELIFVVEAPTSEVVSIVSTVNDLIKKQLLSAKPQIDIQILTTSLSGGLTATKSFSSSLPLHHRQLYSYRNSRPASYVSKTHFYSVIFALICVVVLLQSISHLVHSGWFV